MRKTFPKLKKSKEDDFLYVNRSVVKKDRFVEQDTKLKNIRDIYIKGELTVTEDDFKMVKTWDFKRT